ncbi:hypothetical protein ABEB36_012298 [Hypothenemus hampei]|uniref:GOLD domain-containing protein n=1 Tax=Hypothenemus hampei TaxID=57062 RepID=A0ABD1EAS2_HYPHA
MTSKTFLAFILCILIQKIASLERRITFFVEPSKEICFFETLQGKNTIQVDFRVLDGGHGDLDISFNLVDPHGRVVVADFKKAEKNHKIDTEADGDYRFCFDNTFSAFNTKLVYFDLASDSEGENPWDFEPDINMLQESGVDVQQIENLHEQMDQIRLSLNGARGLQDTIKLVEAKDRNIAEELFFKVNTYSMVILVVMILVSLVQIIMVKSIFDEKSVIHRLLWFIDATNKK